MKKNPDTKIPDQSRDLSWLAFNYRVLQEAKDARVPLLERIRFMAIFSANLDEFFKVRVATLRRLMRLKKKARTRLGNHPANELEQVLQEILRQQQEFGEIFRRQIVPELAAQKIYLADIHKLTPGQHAFALQYFRENLKPLLRPYLLETSPGHLFLKDQTVYLIAKLPNSENTRPTQAQYALLEIPTRKHGGRFVKLPVTDHRQCFIFIDDLIRLGLPELFPGADPNETNTIKLSRDAELDLEETVSGNLLARIRKSLKKREKGIPARLLIDPGMPPELLWILKQKTGVRNEEIVTGSIYHHFRDFFSFPELVSSDLKYKPLPPLPHPTFRKPESIFETISRQEVLLYYPYHSYAYTEQFFKEAAEDQDVSSINVTLYRVARRSRIVKSLIKAARNGKFVTVLVELKARFDEETNIAWARKLEKAGAYVIYGLPDYKVHCKLALVTRREKHGPVNYAYLSTGNFNENTAEVYTDYGFFTKDERLTQEMDQVFRFFIDQAPVKTFKHLLVAPFSLRKKLNRLIDAEIRHTHNRQPAYILLKLNSLQDPKIIEKLYEASAAGVKIDLIVRGICTLATDRKDLTRNIKVRSIVDRFLEHARVYYFANGGKEKMYISSADWMTRNLSYRVEVAFPIYDAGLRQQVKRHLELQLQDTVKARRPDNRYYKPGKQKPELQSQLRIYAALKAGSASEK